MEPQAIPPTDFDWHLPCSCTIQSCVCQCTHVTNHGLPCIAAVILGVHPLELVGQVSCQVEFWNCVPHQEFLLNGDARKTIAVQQAAVHALLELLGLLAGGMHWGSIHDLIDFIQVLQALESVDCVWISWILVLCSI